MKSELRARHSRDVLNVKKQNAESEANKHKFNTKTRYSRYKKDKNRSRFKAVVMALPLLLYVVSIWTCLSFLPQKNVMKPRIFLLNGDTNSLNHYLPFLRKNNVTHELSVLSDFGSDPLGPEIQNKSTTCVPLVEWQELSFPTCNILHEINLMTAEYTNSGMNRDVWMIKDAHRDNVAIKTLAKQHSFSPSMINKQRIDAIVSERSTSSAYIVNIYAYCGASSINEFSFKGSLENMYKSLSLDSRLSVAVDISRALVDLHSLGDSVGRPAVVHADIAVRQFLNIDGKFKLNDFNTAGLVYKRADNPDELCPHMISKAKDKNRAPEEMIHEDLNPVTEKIDVYSLGNIFFKFLTNERKYDDIRTADAQQRIVRGDPVDLPAIIQKSRHPVHIALIKAMEMCLQRNASERSTAKEVYFYLLEAFSAYKTSIF